MTLPLFPGEIVDGKYEVLGILGRGGMGVVFAANHLVLRERVAIKALVPALATDDKAVERFLREARAVAKIQSSHVARVLDVTKLNDGSPCIVMEYLEGEDLGQLLEREAKIPYSRAVEYVLEACEALAEAHAQGIVHRDLKPSNLFLSKTRSGGTSIKVLDFGISKLVLGDDELALTKTRTMLGSPLYMSPEQLKNARSVDARSDIWSLGAILFELISGEPPFLAESIAELGALVLTTDAPSMNTVAKSKDIVVPDVLAAAIGKCLRRDPDERFVNLADFADAIGSFGGDNAQTSSSRILRTVPMTTVTAVRSASTPKHVGRAEMFDATKAATPPSEATSAASQDDAREPLTSTRSTSSKTIPPRTPSRLIVVIVAAALSVTALTVIVVVSLSTRKATPILAAPPTSSSILTVPTLAAATSAAPTAIDTQPPTPTEGPLSSASTAPPILGTPKPNASPLPRQPKVVVPTAPVPRPVPPPSSSPQQPSSAQQQPKELWDPR